MCCVFVVAVLFCGVVSVAFFLLPELCCVLFRWVVWFCCVQLRSVLFCCCCTFCCVAFLLLLLRCAPMFCCVVFGWVCFVLWQQGVWKSYQTSWVDMYDNISNTCKTGKKYMSSNQIILATFLNRNINRILGLFSELCPSWP